MTETIRAFKDAIQHMIIMIDKKAVVYYQDAKYLLDACIKLLAQHEEVSKSRDKWRARAEAAEAKLKQS